MTKPFNKVLYTGWIGLDSQLTFGRHIGYTVNEVLKDRPEYIAWLIDNTEIKFYESVHEQVNKLFPPVVDPWKVPKDISYWQDGQFWKYANDTYIDDIPF